MDSRPLHYCELAASSCCIIAHIGMQQPQSAHHVLQGHEIPMVRCLLRRTIALVVIKKGPCFLKPPQWDMEEAEVPKPRQPSTLAFGSTLTHVRLNRFCPLPSLLADPADCEALVAGGHVLEDLSQDIWVGDAVAQSRTPHGTCEGRHRDLQCTEGKSGHYCARR